MMKCCGKKSARKLFTFTTNGCAQSFFRCTITPSNAHIVSRSYDTNSREATMTAYSGSGIIQDRHDGIQDPSDKKQPSYLAELIEDAIPSRNLRSSACRHSTPRLKNCVGHWCQSFPPHSSQNVEVSARQC